MTKKELDQFQAMINASLFKFWEEILEPVIATKSDLEKLATKEELGLVNGELSSVKTELTEVHHKVDSIDRKLGSEISYRDRLEKRVVKIETKVGINK